MQDSRGRWALLLSVQGAGGRGPASLHAPGQAPRAGWTVPRPVPGPQPRPQHAGVGGARTVWQERPAVWKRCTGKRRRHGGGRPWHSARSARSVGPETLSQSPCEADNDAVAPRRLFPYEHKRTFMNIGDIVGRSRPAPRIGLVAGLAFCPRALGRPGRLPAVDGAQHVLGTPTWLTAMCHPGRNPKHEPEVTTRRAGPGGPGAKGFPPEGPSESTAPSLGPSPGSPTSKAP